jgi:hypothetical protein
MTDCYFCKKELPEGKNYCTHCDHTTSTEDPFETTSVYKRRSNAWYLLPIFLGAIGGVIAIIILRNDDLTKGAYCLIIGIVMMVVGIVLNLFISDLIREIPNMINL